MNQDIWWCGACFSVACLEASIKKAFSLSGRLSSGFPFVVCNSLQALPHPTSVRAGVVGFNLNPVLMHCLFDGSSEGIAGFLIGAQLVSRSLKAAALAFSSMWMLPVIQGFWLRYVRTVTVGTTSSMHLLMKPMTEVVYSSMPLDESQNIFQSVLAKQSCSIRII